ncbi:hypothetical protein D3C81_1769560 [compost metagenome]
MAVTNNAFPVDQERFRRAVHPQIQTQHPVAVKQAQRIRITQLFQPDDSFLAIVFVVQTHNPNALR